MDWTALPYELQFQYLLGLPIQDILKYCQTNTVSYQIWQTEQFWRQKALQEFNIDLDVIREGSPAQKYGALERLYQEAPEQLVLELVTTGCLSAIPQILERLDAINVTLIKLPNRWVRYDIDYDPIIRELFETAVQTGRPETLQGLLDLVAGPFYKTRFTDLLNDFLRGAFFDAVLMDRLDLVGILRQYYDLSRDNSEELKEWFWQWRDDMNPKILGPLSRAGINLPEDDD